MPTFAELGLIAPLTRALEHEGYEQPTPIQQQAIPPLLAGRDVLGCAQTGTGKTAAFSLPILQHLAELPPSKGRPPIRVLVLTPTRELAAQIGESFSAYGRFLRMRHMVMFGGVGENPQIAELRRGIDILIATPGRLLDLMGRGYVDLGTVDFFVLDEADRMLDMGFIRDVRKILLKLPTKKQNLLFSATMPRPIVELASSFLHDPIKVEVTPSATTVERIDQSVMFVERTNKPKLLASLLDRPEFVRAIVFTRTKHGANKVVKYLDRDGFSSAAIHGNKSQSARERALEGFKRGEIRVLVATDIAARGIDVDGVSHVINYDLSNEPEVYVHRIGRTGRAGADGRAIAFCDETETGFLRDIQRTIGLDLPVDDDQPYHYPAAMPRGGSGGRGTPRPPSPQRGGQPRGGGGGTPRGGRPNPPAHAQRGGGHRPNDARSADSVGSPDGQSRGGGAPRANPGDRGGEGDRAWQRPKRRRQPAPGAPTDSRPAQRPPARAQDNSRPASAESGDSQGAPRRRRGPRRRPPAR